MPLAQTGMAAMYSDRTTALKWLESDLMDTCADYVARGRTFATLSSEQLSNAWIRALRTMISDVSNPAFRLVQGDLTSEFSLRKQEPPYNMVAEEMEQFAAETQRMLMEIGLNNPQGLENVARHLEKQLRVFRDAGEGGH